MESPRKTRGLIGKLLVVLLLGLTAWGFVAQCNSDAAHALTNKEDTSLYVALLTQPAMTASLNPGTHKVIVTTVKRKKIPQDIEENVRDLFQKASIQTRQLRYYVPQTLNRDEYWEQFRHTLSTWRFQPLLVARIIGDYILAWKEQRTNLSPAEFLLYGLELSRLEITDFTVSTKAEPTKKKKGSIKEVPAYIPPPPPIPKEEEEARPLVIEILNASGKKGAARELTQYLRDKNQKGLLNVDVLNQDNFPGGRHKETRIIDYAGRRERVKQLSTAIGINSEISSEKQDNPLYDVRIILGEDFKQPM